MLKGRSTCDGIAPLGRGIDPSCDGDSYKRYFNVDPWMNVESHSLRFLVKRFRAVLTSIVIQAAFRGRSILPLKVGSIWWTILIQRFITTVFISTMSSDVDLQNVSLSNIDPSNIEPLNVGVDPDQRPWGMIYLGSSFCRWRGGWRRGFSVYEVWYYWRPLWRDCVLW